MPIFHCQDCRREVWSNPNNNIHHLDGDQTLTNAHQNGFCKKCYLKRRGGKKVGMIRMYRNLAEKFFLFSLFIQNNGIDYRRVREEARYHWLDREGGKEEIRKIVYDIFDNDVGGTVDEAIEEMAELLSQKTEHQDKTLIDKMVEILKLPFINNVLNTRTIDALRRAILLPDEMVDLAQSIQQQEMSCANCGKRFQHGEMITMTYDRGHGMIYCGLCVTPTIVPCHGCKEGIPVGRKLEAAIQKSCECAVCIEKRKGKEVNLHVHDENEPQQVIPNHPIAAGTGDNPYDNLRARRIVTQNLAQARTQLWATENIPGGQVIRPAIFNANPPVTPAPQPGIDWEAIQRQMRTVQDELMAIDIETRGLTDAVVELELTEGRGNEDR